MSCISSNYSLYDDDELSTESAVQQRATVVYAKNQCVRAIAAVERAKLHVEAKMMDVQVAEREQDLELTIRSHQALQKAQQEYQKKQGYRDVLLNNYSNLAESEVHATTQRDVAKYGSLGRVPSSSMVVSKELRDDENPWLDADVGSYFRGVPPFCRGRVAKFYKKFHWDRALGSRGKVQCMVTGVWSCTSRDVTVGRILPKSTCKSVLEQLGLSKGDINNPRNMLLLASNIKKYFDLQRLTFVIHEDGMAHEMGLRFRVKVWDICCMKKKVFKGSSVTIGDVDGKVFRFYSDESIPFLRALSLHAQKSYERALKKDYLRQGETRPAEFGSPLLCESITCDDSADDDDDFSLESDRSIATERMLEPLDYEVND